MLKIGSITYRIQHDRHHEKIFLTVWRDRILVAHAVCTLRRSKGGADFFIYRDQLFYVSEFVTPLGSYRTPRCCKPNLAINTKFA